MENKIIRTEEDQKNHDNNLKELLFLRYKDRKKKDEFIGTEEAILPITWNEFDKLELPRDRWLIKQILPSEGLGILASPSGEKKTWVAMGMARCIANGSDFLGNLDFKAEKRNVLYIDQEMSKTEIQRRGRLLGLHNTENAIYLLSRNEFNLSKKESINWLLGFIAEKNIGAVFVDTLRAVAGGLEENKAEDVRSFFNEFKALKDKGVFVLFLDHCRKPSIHENKEPKKEQVLASQDKVASIEVLLMIKSDERSEDILFYQKKSRSSVECKSFKIIMKDIIDDEVNTIAIELNYGGDIGEREYMLDKARNMIMDVLYSGGKKRKEILTILLERKIGGKNASEAIRSLEKEGKITSKKEGRENFYQINADFEEVADKVEQGSLLDEF